METNPETRTIVNPEKLLTVRGTERRKQIVATAIKHIAAEGLEGFRVRSVAGEIGINNATLHHYFPTKEDLIRAVIEYIIEHFAAVSRQTYSYSHNAAGENALKRHFQMIRRQFVEYPELFLVLNELSLRAHRDTKVAEFISISNEAWVKFLTDVFKQSKIKKAELNYQILAELCMATFKGFSLQLGEKGVFGRLAQKEKVDLSGLDKMIKTLETFVENY